MLIINNLGGDIWMIAKIFGQRVKELRNNLGIRESLIKGHESQIYSHN